MSNSTQKNEIKQIEKAIYEGFAESEKDIKNKKTPFDKPTQNDNETLDSKFSIPNDELYTKQELDKAVADARREVIDRVESEDVVNRAWIKIDGNEFILVGKEFLATLREEEQK